MVAALGLEWKRVQLEVRDEVGWHQIGQAPVCQVTSPYPWSVPGNYTFLKKCCHTKSPTEKDGLFHVKMRFKSRKSHHSPIQSFRDIDQGSYHGPSVVTGIRIQPILQEHIHIMPGKKGHSENRCLLSSTSTEHGLCARHCIRCSVKCPGLHLNDKSKAHSVTTTRPPGHQNGHLLTISTATDRSQDLKDFLRS